MQEDRIVRESITQDRARKLLATVDEETYRFKKNNHLRHRESMRRGTFNGLASIPLVVDFDGNLWNGRHRLSAMVSEGIAEIEFYVRYCSPEAAMDFQRLGDSPSAWSMTDELKAEGAANRTVLASAIGYLHRFRNPGGVLDKQSPSRDIALEIYRNHPRLRHYVPLVLKAARTYRVSAGMCAAHAYITDRMGVDYEDILRFWNELALVGSTSLGDAAARAKIPASNPVWRFQMWLEKSQPKHGQAVRRSANVTWVFLVKTWNAWAEHRSLHALSWRENEGFPAVSDGYGVKLYAGTDEAKQLLG